jgi:hypothetical protein
MVHVKEVAHVPALARATRIIGSDSTPKQSRFSIWPVNAPPTERAAAAAAIAAAGTGGART